MVLRTFTTRGQSGVCPFCLAGANFMPGSHLQPGKAAGQGSAERGQQGGVLSSWHLLVGKQCGHYVCLDIGHHNTLPTEFIFLFFFISNALLFMKFIYI